MSQVDWSNFCKGVCFPFNPILTSTLSLKEREVPVLLKIHLIYRFT